MSINNPSLIFNQNPNQTLPKITIIQNNESSANQLMGKTNTKTHILKFDQAAPFPNLPSKTDVIQAINEIDMEIKKEKADLATFMRQLSINEYSHPIKDQSDKCLGLISYKSFLISNSLIDQVIKDNEEHVFNANAEAQIHNLSQYSHISQLPHISDTIASQNSKLPLLFTPIYWRTKIVEEKKLSLANHYKNLQSCWISQCNLIDVLNVKTHKCNDEWPPEIENAPSKPYDAPDLTIGIAPDVEMILDPLEKRAQCFADKNKFVADPVAEHNAFRKRLAWTEEERATFFTAFSCHPKQFALIAKQLPMKTVKDVIEFYYVEKNKLNDYLKAGEIIQKRRGMKKKVITEGTVTVKERK